MSTKNFLKNNIIPVLAVIIALTIMSFKLAGNTDGNTKSAKDSNTEATLVDYKWFQISGTYNLTARVRQIDAVYLGTGPTPPMGTGCATSGAHQCVSGFNASQVNSSNQLIDDNQAPAQTPRKKM